MVYTYTPTYYSSLHDSITSLCKTMLPFSFKKRRLPGAIADQKLLKQQSDNLKWQQDSFHQILNLMGLCKEGIVPEREVSAFRMQLLDIIVASPADQEQPVVLRDKLLFLQELLYAKCISGDEYHSSKRPLLQRLAVQGVEIEARDITLAKPTESSEEEWSVIDLRDEQCLLNKDSSHSKPKSKQGSAVKQIKGATSVLNFVSSYKLGKNKEGKEVNEPNTKHFRPIRENICSSSATNPFWDSHLKDKEIETRSILMPESLPPEPIKVENESAEKVKKKPIRTLFQREQRDGNGVGGYGPNSENTPPKSAKKQWGFDGFKKWKRSNREDEEAPLPLSERSDNKTFSESCQLVESPMGEGPDTKQIKRKLHPDGSASDFFIDKVLGDKIKKELSRIQSELCSTNPNLQFSNDQIEAISTKLPVEKSDLKKFFPKSWCDRYGDVVLDVVRKEFKDHVGEMENMRNNAREKRENCWAKFDDEDDENCHPNLFGNHQDRSLPMKQGKFTSTNSNGCNFRSNSKANKCFETNPFFQDYQGNDGEKLRSKSLFDPDYQNPFWSPRKGSSMFG
ncbi:uncharacterized protein LOC131157898 [Malania oleifera]|uniref:uncharacterized protein LOC131157898 n=1 Tax=Malania oleifera TaxID=397392 RepID=UPI0025AE091D|nr:uncharacterized protein LOC131157898 [Malania oleifera]